MGKTEQNAKKEREGQKGKEGEREKENGEQNERGKDGGKNVSRRKRGEQKGEKGIYTEIKKTKSKFAHLLYKVSKTQENNIISVLYE